MSSPLALAPGGAVYSPNAMRRLRRLCSFAAGLRQARAELGDRRRALHEERVRRERTIRDLEAELQHPRGVFVMRSEHDRRSADRYESEMQRALGREQQQLSIITDELADIEARDQRERPVRDLVGAFAEELARAMGFDRGGVADRGVMPAAILVAGDGQRARLDELQAEIGAMQAEIRATANAPMAPEEVREFVGRELRSAVAAARLDHLYAGLSRGEPGLLVARDDYDRRRLDALMIDAAHGIDVVAERIAASAMAREQYQPGLPRAERAARVRELEARLATLHRDEEREALRLEDDADGTLVVRRPVAALDLPMIAELWAA